MSTAKIAINSSAKLSDHRVTTILVLAQQLYDTVLVLAGP